MTILGRSEELVSRCVECDLAEPESLSSLGGSAPGVVDGILSALYGCWRTSSEVLIEIGLVLIAHGNENPFQHGLVCIFIILGHENVKKLILVEVI